jgi:hypothetical protein
LLTPQSAGNLENWRTLFNLPRLRLKSTCRCSATAGSARFSLPRSLGELAERNGELRKEAKNLMQR